MICPALKLQNTGFVGESLATIREFMCNFSFVSETVDLQAFFIFPEIFLMILPISPEMFA